MITIDYIRWFHYVARKNHFSVVTRGVFQYLFECAIERGSDVAFTTQDVMSTDLSISRSSLKNHLQILRQTNLVAGNQPRGQYKLLPPSPTWVDKFLGVDKVRKFEESIDRSLSSKPKCPLVSRASGQPGVGDTPPKGVSSLPQKPPHETSAKISSQDVVRAKALTSSQLLELKEKLGVPVDIRLRQFAALHPDEVWENPNNR